MSYTLGQAAAWDWAQQATITVGSAIIRDPDLGEKIIVAANRKESIGLVCRFNLPPLVSVPK